MHSREEHEQFFLKHFEGYKEGIYLFAENFIEVMRIKAALKKGSDYKADRELNKLHNHFIKDVSLFNDLVLLRKSRTSPNSFNMIVDEILFCEQFNIENDSLKKLESEICDSDLLKSGKYRLFKFLTFGATRRKVLFARSFYPGLRKILAESNT